MSDNFIASPGVTVTPTDSAVAGVGLVSTGLNYPAIIASVVAVGGPLSNALGYPALGVAISDPHNAALATSACAAIAALVAAFSGPVHAMITHVSSVVHKA